MNMTNLHDAMVKTFGLPHPVDPQYSEVFGCYHWGTKDDDETLFWEHDREGGKWRVVSACTPVSRFIPFAELSEAENEALRKATANLNMMARPALPDDTGTCVSGKPFIHDGWLFQWVFLPELRRWELAPLGKR